MRSEWLGHPKRIVVKLGTGVLTDERKHPDLLQMQQLVRQLAELRKRGREVVIVTSGAVGAGMGVLGFQKRPSELSEQQACAAVGQSRLMATYEKLFEPYRLHVAQVLLTHDDLQDHARHLNGRKTLLTLLKHGVIPVINENDAISSTELKFGDNDRLSALVAALLPADLLVILTTVDGMIENYGKSNARLLSVIEKVDRSIEQMAGGTLSQTAVGGMSSKIQAAKIVVRSGIPLVIASGRKQSVLADILDGQDEGSLFVPDTVKLSARKRWIAFFHHPRGCLVVDEGARVALQQNGRSLLRPGIVRHEGDFSAGDLVCIRTESGQEIARGIAEYGAEDLAAARKVRSEIVHRDNLVIL